MSKKDCPHCGGGKCLKLCKENKIAKKKKNHKKKKKNIN